MTAQAQTDFHQQIVDEVLSLYHMNFTPESWQHFSKDAKFRDPLTDANGLAVTKSVFVALPKIFSRTEITKATPEYFKEDNLLTIDMSAKWFLKPFQIPLKLDSKVYLWIKDNQIVRIEDRWNDQRIKDSFDGKWGSILETWRTANARFIHALMKQQA